MHSQLVTGWAGNLAGLGESSFQGSRHKFFDSKRGFLVAGKYISMDLLESDIHDIQHTMHKLSTYSNTLVKRMYIICIFEYILHTCTGICT